MIKMWRKQVGMSLVETLIAFGLVTMVVLASTVVLPKYVGSIKKVEFSGNVTDVRRYVREKIDCQQTFEVGPPPACNGSNIAIKDAAGATFISSDGLQKIGNLQVRASCATGTSDIKVEYKILRGTIVNDFAPDPMNPTAPIVWRSLLGDVPIACKGPPKPNIFVTKNLYKLDRGSREWYSTECNNLAGPAGLPGTWRAILSLSTDYAIDPVDAPFLAEKDAIDYTSGMTYPVINTNNQIVANNAGEFWARYSFGAIGYDEVGGAVGGLAFTGTNENGRYDNLCYTGAGGPPTPMARSCNCVNYNRPAWFATPASFESGAGAAKTYGGWPNTTQWLDVHTYSAACRNSASCGNWCDATGGAGAPSHAGNHFYCVKVSP